MNIKIKKKIEINLLEEVNLKKNKPVLVKGEILKIKFKV